MFSSSKFPIGLIILGKALSENVFSRSSIKRANIFGLSYALANSVMYFSLAALFRLGVHLVSQGNITLENVLL